MVTRARRTRSNERGAAVFIVVMVISLLSAIGVFAARTASLVDMATGYDRQAVQTHLIADYAGRLTIAELGTGSARAYLDRLNSSKDTCVSTQASPPVNFPCQTFTTDEFTRLVGQRAAGQPLFLAQTTAAAGSLGPQLPGGSASGAVAPVAGLMQVEIIDGFMGETKAGSPSGAGGFMDVQFTLTAYAQVRDGPTATPVLWCNNATTAVSASSQTLRSHVTVTVPKN
jgi:hypothetical protein